MTFPIIEMLLCPKCKNKAEYLTTTAFDIRKNSFTERHIFRCNNCGRGLAIGKTIEEAAKMWMEDTW
jgi:uncharacterized protein YbaR (Trm112 family)